MATKLAMDPGDILASAGPTISIPELAQVLGISRDTAYRLADRDELPVRVLQLGRSKRAVTAEVRRLLGLKDDSAA